MSTITSPTTPREQLPQASPPSQHGSSTISLQSLGDDVSTLGADMEKHPKGKRKRTAAKDKMVLEDAYRSNPKPDKQARQEVVDRVSLNDKEVQIWFQNRRQNDRRKSRPLSPEELAALRFGGMHHISSDPVSSRSTMANIEPANRSFPSSDPAARPVDQGPVSPLFTLTRPELGRSYSYSDAAIVTPRHHDHGTSPSLSQSQELPSSQKSEKSSESMSHSFSNSVGYLANRWNLGSSFSTPSTLGRGGDDSLRLDPFPPSSCSSDKTYNGQSKSQSQVRLSLSLEGKAELVSGQASPSRPPPSGTPSAASSRVPPRPRGSLSRSHSALPSITLPPISALTSSLPPRLARGRSRDVQAWESCADSERRDELTAQAEHESNGSAIAAISLLRSSSGILQPSSTKRNASLSRPQQPHQAKKAKLSRTSSTFSRLETPPITTTVLDTDLAKPNANPDGKVKVSMLVSPTDSDKENWSPDEAGHPQQEGHRRRPLPAGSAAIKPSPINPRRLGRALRDHNVSSMLASRSHTAPSRPLGSSNANSTIDIFEDGSAKKNKSRDREDDVEKFMRGEVSPSKKPDMDCVAGLLSLSQGAWR